MKLNEFVNRIENIGKSKLNESLIWTDVYKIFDDIIDVVYPEEEKIISMVEALYNIGKGNPAWDEAYRRFMAPYDEEENDELE